MFTWVVGVSEWGRGEGQDNNKTSEAEPETVCVPQPSLALSSSHIESFISVD